jgi:putative endonuclease
MLYCERITDHQSLITNHVEFGGVAERLIAPVLKTGRPKGLVSSNLTPSAILLRARASQDWQGSLREGGCPPKLQRRRTASCDYVYLIESLSAQGERYVGMTTDVKQRLEEHDSGKSSHTSKFKPWKLTTYIAFTDRAKEKTKAATP